MYFITFLLSPPLFSLLHRPLSSLRRWKDPPHGLVGLSHCVQPYTGWHYFLLLLQVNVTIKRTQFQIQSHFLLQSIATLSKDLKFVIHSVYYSTYLFF